MTNNAEYIVAVLRTRTRPNMNVETWKAQPFKNDELSQDAANLIEEQAAEIERLKDQVKALQQKIPLYNPFLL